MTDQISSILNCSYCYNHEQFHPKFFIDILPITRTTNISYAGNAYIGAGLSLTNSSTTRSLCDCFSNARNSWDECAFSYAKNIDIERLVFRSEIKDYITKTHYIVEVVYKSKFATHIYAGCYFAKEVKRRPLELEIFKYHMGKVIGSMLASYYITHKSTMDNSGIGPLAAWLLNSIFSIIDENYVKIFWRKLYFRSEKYERLFNSGANAFNDHAAFIFLKDFYVPNTLVETFRTYSHVDLE